MFDIVVALLTLNAFLTNNASLFEALPLYLFKSHYSRNSLIFLHLFVDSSIEENCDHKDFKKWVIQEKNFVPNNIFRVKKNSLAGRKICKWAPFASLDIANFGL